MSASDGLEPDHPGLRVSRARAMRFVLSLLALGSAYFVAGKLGLLLAVGNASVSVVWPATGIAIAALMLGGAELWPAVFLGAFLVNLTTTGEFASSLGIATGNTLEGLVGAYLATRLASGKQAFTHPRSVLSFVLFAGLVAPTIAATVGTLSLILAHLASPAAFAGVWVPWWLGDAIGAIEVTPLILALAQRVSTPMPFLGRPGPVEAVTVGGLALSIALIVFARDATTVLGGYPLIFLVIPPIVWAAFRFGPLGATASVSTVSAVAIVSTVVGEGPFATLPTGLALLSLRIFAGSLAVTALLVAADSLQHRRLEFELNHARKELQRMLQARTAELDSAKSLAKVGTWSYDARTHKMIWSEEMYPMFGYGERRFPAVLGHAVERLHPADRARFMQALRSCLGASPSNGAEPLPQKYRLLLPTGETRTVLHSMQPAGVEDGHVTRVAGTAQDITERQHLDDELRRLAGGDSREGARPERFGLWMIPSVAPWPRTKAGADTTPADPQTPP